MPEMLVPLRSPLGDLFKLRISLSYFPELLMQLVWSGAQESAF